MMAISVGVVTGFANVDVAAGMLTYAIEWIGAGTGQSSVATEVGAPLVMLSWSSTPLSPSRMFAAAAFAATNAVPAELIASPASPVVADAGVPTAVTAPVVVLIV